MAGILDPDWKETMLGTPGFSVTEYVKKYWQDKAAKDASVETDVEGGGDQETYALPSGETTTDWAESEHERMYPGMRAAANAAGFNYLGATEWGNKDYKARMDKISTMAGKPGQKFFSEDYIRVFKPKTLANPYGNTAEQVNEMIDNLGYSSATSAEVHVDNGILDVVDVLDVDFEDDMQVS